MIPKDLANHGYRWRYDKTDKPKSLRHRDEQDNGQNGVVPSAIEKPRLNPDSQGDQDDHGIERRKKTDLNTRC